MRFDAAIVGGGVAGLQAALTLARSRRSVLLIDAGLPRHRFATHMHNFLGADGLSPDAFYARVHAELAQYPHVARLQAQVTHVQHVHGVFQLTDDKQATHEARKLVFANGVRDELPDIEGLAPLWGQEVQHCSYCHGYEARDKSIAVLTSAQDALGMAESLLSLSSRLEFYFSGDLPDDAILDRLQANGIGMEYSKLDAVERSASGLMLHLANGQARQCDVLFVKPHTAADAALPSMLGCQLQNGFVQVNEWGQTHVPGVYAAGDITGGVHQLVAAAGSGLFAAMMLNTELARETLR